jgi:hypothetical protein
VSLDLRTGTPVWKRIFETRLELLKPMETIIKRTRLLFEQRIASNNSIALLPEPVFNRLEGVPIQNICSIFPESIAFWHSFGTVSVTRHEDKFVNCGRIRS